MTPGAPAQPLDDVVSLSWNKEGWYRLMTGKVKIIHYSFMNNCPFLFPVKHIIASTFSTRCLIWDLRKNQPIIKLPDFTSTVSKYINFSNVNAEFR